MFPNRLSSLLSRRPLWHADADADAKRRKGQMGYGKSDTKEVRASSEQDSRTAERSKTSESTHRHSLILTLTQNSSTIISLQAACFRVPLSDELSQGSPCEAKVLGTCFSHGVPCITRQCQHGPETSCLSSRHESQRAYPHITLISSFAIPSKEVLASSRRLGSRTNRPRQPFWEPLEIDLLVRAMLFPVPGMA